MKKLPLAILAALPAMVARVTGREYRSDAAETMALARQLEFVQSEMFDIQYAAPKALEFIPLDSTIPAGAQQFTYREWDVAGLADVIANPAQDLNRVDLSVKEYPKKVTLIGDAYGYSIEDLRSAAFGNIALDAQKARAAKQAIDRKIDELLSVGSTALAMEGFVNNSAVPLTAGLTGNWTGGATPDQIIADVTKMVSKVVKDTKDLYHPDTLLVPLDHYNHLFSTPRSSQSDTSIGKFILNTSPSLKEIHPWHRLSDAGAGSVPRAVCYQKDPMVVRAVVPLPFEQQAPEIRNLEWLINCVAKVGGTVWYRPKAATYGDSI